MSTGADLTAHYSPGRLLARLDDALRQDGIDPNRMAAEDLWPAEHFHSGGHAATVRFLDGITLPPTGLILDLGCGIGGVSRAIAARTSAHVHGIDLTPDFIETGRALNARLGLDRQISLTVGSITDLDLPPKSADMAVMVHVGMNIADKQALFAQIHAALRPGATFAIFDVMLGPDQGPLQLPVPWSTQADTSHLACVEAYVALAQSAGFSVLRQTDYRAAKLSARSDRPAPKAQKAVGPHVVMGDTYALKALNYRENLIKGRTTPVELILRREA